MRRNVGLDELQERIRSYEEIYRISTEKFLSEIRSGRLDENEDFVDWLFLVKAIGPARLRSKALV